MSSPLVILHRARLVSCVVCTAVSHPFLTILHNVPGTHIMAPFPAHVAYCTRYTYHGPCMWRWVARVDCPRPDPPPAGSACSAHQLSSPLMAVLGREICRASAAPPASTACELSPSWHDATRTATPRASLSAAALLKSLATARCPFRAATSVGRFRL